VHFFDAHSLAGKTWLKTGGRVEQSRPGQLSCMAGFAPITHGRF